MQVRAQPESEVNTAAVLTRLCHVMDKYNESEASTAFVCTSISIRSVLRKHFEQEAGCARKTI